jgi:hypothetical protein
MSKWVEFLSKQGICRPDAEGNMPCDNGCMCDKCSHPWIQAKYERYLEEHKND